MPPFNWFNRGNKKPEPEKEAPPVQRTPQQDAKQEQPAESTQDAEAQQPAIAQDYLSWAKVAYQNIQKQKTAEAPSPEAPSQRVPESQEAEQSAPQPASSVEPEVTDAQEVEPEATNAVTTPEMAEQEETAVEVLEPEPTPESKSAETVEAEPATSAVLAEPDVPAPEAPVEETPRTPEPSASEPTPTAQGPLPFWAKAEVERQERLEKLKAEAIAEPEPLSDVAQEPASAEPTQVEATPEAVEFDENFIWSASVLAAQGRRPDDISEEEITWLQRLRQGLGKTRRGLINQLRGIVGQGPLNQDAVMEIESLLLQADVGIEATDYVIEALQERMRQETLPPEAAIAYLKDILRSMLDQPFQGDYEQTFTPQKDILNIWLITGVNGAGKTTTIGKLAHMARKSDYRCLIAAADTFRAAAVEQVKIWGQRSNVDVIANPGQNTDPAAVVFDAITAAKSRGTELLLVDTAGRLQNKKNLMAELQKIRRILDKKAPDAKIESLLVLDATLGQNGLRQAEVFAEAAQLSGVVLTKLDGTAKGGVALAVVKQLGLPLRFIGAGEGIEDLRPFSSYEFVEALLSG